MNDIIQRLIAEAGTDVSGKWISMDNAEKFAELIIKDCISNVQVWEKDSRNHISYMLKQHFGVGQ